MKSDKLIAVHNGALGDFLCAWPALLALARGAGSPGSGPVGTGPDSTAPEHAAAQGGEESASPRLLFAGNMERMRWLAPLGYASCPPAMRRALDGLYGKSDAPVWPDALAGATVAWFCLDRAPVAAHPRVVPLPCLMAGAGMSDRDAGTGDRAAEPAMHICHVTEVLRKHLARACPAALPWPPRWDAGWQGTWQTLFGGWKGADSRTVVLVPGAGHRAKQWPPRRFAEVTGALARAGYNPLYVLGPAELERGLDRADLMPKGCEVPVVTPADHDELTQLLRHARLVIGNDSGPLHLAALHGVPVLALFGPAPAGAWCPHGATPFASPLACAPCSATLRELACGWGQGNGKIHGEQGAASTAGHATTAPCMTAITVQAVLDITWKLLGISGEIAE